MCSSRVLNTGAAGAALLAAAACGDGDELEAGGSLPLAPGDRLAGAAAAAAACHRRRAPKLPSAVCHREDIKSCITGPQPHL